ncbi:MAG: asparagine synthase (glutamine-hydrolyzing), partial [Bryobacteraceae bacterium]|nr:asparagine synthase (glutamine-hydrolyzing) [Bryobacteraceae bacterium]
MCGICGIFDLMGNPIDASVLAKMNGVIRHRGPDGDGQLVDGEIGLGHRRLSIIDVGGGGQPIGNEDGSIQIVFNGEIYNFVELREELEKAGHRFRTRSDTEVIVHAYEQWGDRCVQKFNGMFAFAIWDKNRREVFIARDHLGIKPLYYVRVGTALAFASEIKSLLQFPGCPRETDLEALAELFTFRYVPSPKTLFRGILKLPPAHTMRLSRETVDIERYWNWVPVRRTGASEGQLTEEYQALLEDAVRLQLRSDVPLGLFLSSGVDSAALLALMRRHSTSNIETFTIGFEGGEATNEIDDARRIAEQFGAAHHHQILAPEDYMRYYDRYMYDVEEPLGNETAASFYFVAKLTAERVKVALTGQGADEPWAGYHRYLGVKLSNVYSRIPRVVTSSFEQIAGRLSGRMERMKRGAASLAEPDMLTRFAKVYSFFSADMKELLYTGALKREFEKDPFGTRHALARLQGDVRHLDPLTQMLYIDTRANLPDDLLMVSDKTSMACSLEARVPFLDYRLVEFVESLPPRLKLRGWTGKYLHKKACEKWLPREVVYRQKKGFANPVEDWFRDRMKPFVEECLFAKDSSMAQYFDQNYIRKIFDLDCARKEQYRRHVYLLVSLELWHRTFI